jgi:hypothetical protein
MITKNPETFTISFHDLGEDKCEDKYVATREELEQLRNQIDLVLGPTPKRTAPITPQELERYVVGLPSSVLPVSYDDRFMLYWSLDSKINCIKMLRESFGLGLKDAKDMYDYMRNNRSSMAQNTCPFVMADLRPLANEAERGALAPVQHTTGGPIG